MTDCVFNVTAPEDFLSLASSSPTTSHPSIRVSALYSDGSLNVDAIPGALCIDDSLTFEVDPRCACDESQVVVESADLIAIDEVTSASPSSVLRIVARGKESQRLLFFKVGSHDILEDITAKVREIVQKDAWERQVSVSSPCYSLAETGVSGICSFDLRGLFDQDQGTHIISADIAEEIIYLLPLSVRFCRWSLAYSPQIHGVSLQTFYRNLEGRGPSVLVIRDADDHIFGGFATASWAPAGRYFGSGESFVFTCGDEVRAFRAAYSNDFYQFADDTRFSMGGGASSAIVVESNFLRGVSQACSTYKNPQLSIMEDFVVRDLEVWCFDEK